MSDCDISVVIPTYNRAKLLEQLLESLYIAAEKYRYGKTEVLVIDSSEGIEKEKIQEACRRYHANYLEGTDSVRQKRNQGIRAASYSYILFEDSDVTVDPDIFNQHARVYIDSIPEEHVAGSLGLTVFQGEDNLVWKIVEYTTLTDSFSFAEKWPYQDWTIGNNVSFKKEVLEEIGLFEEAFPFRLGADDLDLSYRITKAGYRIKSQPRAVAYHSKDTWKKWYLVKERAKRWGRMEYYLSQRHSQIFINRFPKTVLVMLLLFLIFGFMSVSTHSFAPAAAYLIGLLLIAAASWWIDTNGTGRKNPFLYGCARILDFYYYFGHIFEGLKHRSLSGIYKQLSFSAGQTKMILTMESKRMRMLFFNMAVMFVLTVLLL